MKRVKLSRIAVEGDRILYEVVQDVGLGLLKQDSVKLFVRFHNLASEHVDLEKVPQSILAVPISLYLLPLTYFYKIELVIPTMDKMLYGRLPEIYAAYSKMYGPFSENWRGKLTVLSVVETPVANAGRYNKVVFFSGGVDACSAGINNQGRKTILVSIPDIETEARNEGPLREEKFSLIRRFAEIVDSDWALISNNFNATLYNDREINNYLRDQKGLNSSAFKFDGWAGIKYLANMCCVAPLAYACGIQKLVMGSTFEPIEENPREIGNDGAHPLLSNSISFAGIGFAEQDELYTRRSEKVRRIIEWCNLHGKKVKLWVCFRDGSSQCGVCNKCVRTQLNILCAGENPRDWGFDTFEEAKFSKLIKSYRYLDTPCWHWDADMAIDSEREYPYCNDMLHWLKRIGYKQYLNRAMLHKVWSNRLRLIVRIFFVHKYPYYAMRICERLVKCLKSARQSKSDVQGDMA